MAHIDVNIPMGLKCSSECIGFRMSYWRHFALGVLLVGTASGQCVFDPPLTRQIIEKNAADAINVKSKGAKGNGIADDSAAILLAAAAAASSGKNLYFPAGTYLIDNSKSPLTISGHKGAIFGDGSSSLLKCSNLDVGCILFEGATGLKIGTLAVAYGPPATVRGAPQLLEILHSSGIALSELELYNGNSSGLVIDSSKNISMDHLCIHDMKANPVFLTNVSHVRASNLQSERSGDAAFEVSYYDSSAPYRCYDITANGIFSSHDAVGILVNGCQGVHISGFYINNTYSFGVSIRQDSRTTHKSWPDDVTIENGLIERAGFSGISVGEDQLSAKFWSVTLSNIVIVESVQDGVTIQSDAVSKTINARLSNVTVRGTGKSYVGFRFGGHNITGTNLVAENTGVFSFLDESADDLVLRQALSIDPNQANIDRRAVVIESVGSVSVEGLTLIDRFEKSRSAIDDISKLGEHKFTGVNPINRGPGWGMSTANPQTVFRIGASP